SVVLPAPFGPINPRISPAATARSTPLMAVSPPKRLTRSRVSRRAAIRYCIGLCRPRAFAEQASWPYQEDQYDQQEPVGVLIRRRDERRAERFHDAKHDAGDQRSRDRAEPPDHDDLEALHRGDDAARRIH